MEATYRLIRAPAHVLMSYKVSSSLEAYLALTRSSLGELLLCYAIFTPERELIEQFSPVLSMRDDEEMREMKRDPLKRLRAIVKQSAFFQNLRFEVSFQSIENMSISADPGRSVITETEPSHVPQVEPATSWNMMSRQNHGKRAPKIGDSNDSELPFVVLPSGEIAFPLQFPIALKREFENSQIKLQVVVTPVCFPDQNQRRLDGILDYLTSTNAMQRFPHHRVANQQVKLIQPLSVSESGAEPPRGTN